MYQETIEELDDGKIRLCRTPEQDSYFAICGEPEGYETDDGEFVSPEDERKRIIDLIEREGLWIYYTEARCRCCGQWVIVDSIGMYIGDLDKGYRDDLIDSARTYVRSCND